MDAHYFEIQGPILFSSLKLTDDRGFFTERFRKDRLTPYLPGVEFVQDNFSHSKPGVLRGLHYQWDLPQGKLVTCTRGRVLDIAVDIRAASPTFGRHIAICLSGDEPSWFWIPAGFAHGFAVLGEEPADLWYKVTNYYNGKGEGAIHWNDADLGIQWELQAPLVSPKDQAAQSFKTYAGSPVF